MDHLKSVDTPIEINQQVDQKKEHSLIGSYRMTIDGGKIFRYDIEKKTIQQAEYTKDDIYKLKGNNKSKLVIEKNSIYIESLNMKNAIKRLSKGKIIFRT